MFYQYQKDNKLAESEKIFTKCLLPVYQKISGHSTIFKKYPSLKVESKIKLYTLKVLEKLQESKFLCEKESVNDFEREKYDDELELQYIDLDYETIHSEILKNIELKENDSGLSDFDEKGNENSQKKIFEINKIKGIIHKSIKSLFTESQSDELFNPLSQIQKKVNKIKKDNNLVSSYNNEILTHENTDEISGGTIEKVNMTESCSTIIIPEKEKDKGIVSYKKYNYFNDPHSNYNNFTRKYIVKSNPKKRFRDIHPFLKTFNPKFLKKENIDKKIFRKFRKFVKSVLKQNTKNSSIIIKNDIFWQKFCEKNLLPPVKIVENNGEIIEHKSFNIKYLIWLFNQEGAVELFNLFSEKEGENVINNFINEYNLKKSKEPNIVQKLREYMKYIPDIYKMDNAQKRIMLEENEEKLGMKEFSEKEWEHKTDLESQDDDNEKTNSNPFYLNFDMICGKNFEEFPYDNKIDDSNERFEFGNSLREQLPNLL